MFLSKLTNGIHVMIDMETLAINHTPLVLSIGAVKFDFSRKESYGEIMNASHGFGSRLFRANFDLKAQERDGLTIDTNTIKWWMKQSPEAIKASFEPSKTNHPYKVLSAFNAYIEAIKDSSTEKDVYLWANGALADIVWLESLYEQYKVPDPFGFRNKMCYRSIMKLLEHEKIEIPESIKHDSLSDAAYQVIQLQHAIIDARVKWQS